MARSLKNTVKETFPGLVPITREVRGAIRTRYVRVANRDKTAFDCPICGYHGPFSDGFKDTEYVIRDTACTRCGLCERHRLQHLVLEELAARRDLSALAVLHIAPEDGFRRIFNERFGTYHTADMFMGVVDVRFDLRAMPVADGSYDVVYASHVLEHVSSDHLALAEIRRVLKPDGFAVLPVPVVSPYTIDYPEPNPQEFEHVRAVGVDYFDRYRAVFSTVEVRSSDDFDERFQLYTYESRAMYPNADAPLRVPMEGDKHPDFVPICYR